MEKLFNYISIGAAAVGGFITQNMGGWDALLKALIWLIVIDYATGLLKGIYTKTLSSEIGFKGIIKKVMIGLIIAGAYQIQSVAGDTFPLRDIVVVFYLCNEGISFIENVGTVLPIPDKIKDVLLQLRDKTSIIKNESEDK